MNGALSMTNEVFSYDLYVMHYSSPIIHEEGVHTCSYN